LIVRVWLESRPFDISGDQTLKLLETKLSSYVDHLFASVLSQLLIDIPHLFKHSPLDRAPVPLAIHHTAFCFTFAFFPDITTPPVLDPNQLEQRLSAGLVSIALNAQKEICVLQKLGGVPLETEEVLTLVNVAVGKAKELHGFLDSQLREDWVGRKVEVR
jgi:exosome complex RNA-binding protein Rrp42 (RNase PH superfamily)